MRVMIAGGGTGGHISPGIAIADALESLAPGVEVFFMGRSGSIEERLVGRSGRAIHTVTLLITAKTAIQTMAPAI